MPDRNVERAQSSHTNRQGQTKVRTFSPEDTAERLRKAFPEIDIDNMIVDAGPNNRHNLLEKWAATVRSVQWWLDN